jgi:hypothetical protein
VIECGDGLAPLRAEHDDFVSGLDSGDFGDIEDSLIHADAAHDWCALTAHKQGETVAEPAIEAISVSGGDKCETHGLGGDEGAVVADGGSRWDIAHGDDPGLPGEYRSELLTGFDERWRL